MKLLWNRRYSMRTVAALVVCASVGAVSIFGVSTSLGSTAARQHATGTQLLVALPGTGQSFDNAVQDILFKDFQKQTGNSITIQNDSSLPSQLAAQEQAHNVSIDVILYATYGDYLQAERQGLLQKLDTSVIPLNRLDPKTVTPYGFRAWAYAAALGYNTHSLANTKQRPRSLEDVFNTTAFPGKRCLYKYPEYGGTLEAALLAAGVPANKLYPLNVPLALKKLGTLKGNVIWWTTGAQVEQALASGACSLALYYSGDYYTMAKVHHEPVAVVWGHSVVETPVLAIPKGAPHLAQSEALLRSIILDRAGQQKLLKSLPYTTVSFRPSYALPLPKSITQWLPAGTNLRTAIYADDHYYATHITDLVKKFNAWLLTQ